MKLKTLEKIRTVTFVSLLLFMSGFTIYASGQDSTATAPPSLPVHWEKWIGIAYLVYEFLTLVIKSNSNLSVIGNILKWLSKGGNRTKKE